MKKKSVVVLLTVTMVIEMTATGCGDKQLALATDRVSVELGYELNTDVAAYVADADIAVETTIDFGAVDVSKLGTYTAVVTYKDQTASLEVDVVDTTAPEAEVVNQVTVGVDEPLYVEDVLTSVTELTGNVMATFDDLADESTDATKDVETTEDMEITEEVEATGASEDMETFVLDDVTVTNDAIVFPTVGEYSVSLTLADESGNSKQVEVPVLVGTEPTFLGIEDLTVTTGAENVDYLSGVTATDSNGNDLTDKIECDDSKVDLSLAGEYEITYTVTDENGFTAKQTAKVTVADGKTSKKDGKSSSTKTETTKTETIKTETGSTNSSNSGSSNSGSSNSGNSNSGSSNSGNSNSGSSNSGDNSGNSNSGSSNSGDNSGSSNSGGGNSGNSNSGSSNNESSNFGNSNSESTTPSGDSGSSNNGSGDHTMSEPDDVIEGDPSLGDNTGTGGNGGGNSTITFN